jgi:hypothetical protein
MTLLTYGSSSVKFGSRLSVTGALMAMPRSPSNAACFAAASVPDHLDARLAGKKPKFPLPIRRFRKLQVVWEGSSKLHLDDKLWPRKKQESRQRKELRSQCDHPRS